MLLSWWILSAVILSDNYYLNLHYNHHNIKNDYNNNHGPNDRHNNHAYKPMFA